MDSAPHLRRLRLALFTLLAAISVFILVTQAGLEGVRRQPSGHEMTLVLSPRPTANPSPFAYAAVDPDMIPALEAAINARAREPLAIIAEGIPPLGYYFPATGNTQFDLPPTLTPTPTPTRTLTRTPTPTLTLTPSRTPRPTQTVAPTETPKSPPTLDAEHLLPPVNTLTPTPSLTPSTTPPPTFTPSVDETAVAFAERADDLGLIDASQMNCAPSGWPVTGVLTQYYHRWHPAIDLGIPSGTAVVATHTAKVLFAGWRTDGYGNLIILQSGRFITYYAHLSDFNVTAGESVLRGSVIGWSGSTGYSSGPHVHYEIRIDDVEVDPLTFESRGFAGC